MIRILASEFNNYEKLDGKKITVKIPDGTANGKLLRIKGEGVPISGTTRKGDLYVKIMVQVPTRLSSKQKDLLKIKNFCM